MIDLVARVADYLEQQWWDRQGTIFQFLESQLSNPETQRRMRIEKIEDSIIRAALKKEPSP